MTSADRYVVFKPQRFGNLWADRTCPVALFKSKSAAEKFADELTVSLIRDHYRGQPDAPVHPENDLRIRAAWREHVMVDFTYVIGSPPDDSAEATYGIFFKAAHVDRPDEWCIHGIEYLLADAQATIEDPIFQLVNAERGQAYICHLGLMDEHVPV